VAANEKPPSVISILRSIERRQRKYQEETRKSINSLITVVEHCTRLLKEKETLQKQLDEAHLFMANPLRPVDAVSKTYTGPSDGLIGTFHLKPEGDFLEDENGDLRPIQSDDWY
jgi:hypothetical protein